MYYPGISGVIHLGSVKGILVEMLKITFSQNSQVHKLYFKILTPTHWCITLSIKCSSASILALGLYWSLLVQ